MFCLHTLRQALLFLFVACFFHSYLVLAKGGTEIAFPPSDDELLRIMLREASGHLTDETDGGRATAAFGKADISNPLEARDLLFGDLKGLDDMVLSSHEEYLRFTVENGPKRKVLNQMGVTFGVSVHPYRGEAKLRGGYESGKLGTTRQGGVNVVVPLSAFAHGSATHYRVTFYYLTKEKTPVGIKKFNLTLVSLPEGVGQQLTSLEEGFRKSQLTSAKSEGGLVSPSSDLAIAQGDESGPASPPPAPPTDQEAAQLKALRESQNTEVLVLDVSKQQEETYQKQAGLSGKVYQLLRQYKKRADAAGFSLMVTDDGSPVEGIRKPPQYVCVSKARYKAVFAPVIEKLEGEGWTIDKGALPQLESEPGEEPDGQHLAEGFVLTKNYLKDDAVAWQKLKPIISQVDDDSEVAINLEQGTLYDGETAQVYVTPLVEGLGFDYEAGDFYEVKVSDGKVALPVKYGEAPTPSWHYRMNIHLSLGLEVNDFQVMVVALPKGRISYITAVYLSKDSEVNNPSSAMLKKAKETPVCNNGQYCPLLIVHPNDVALSKDFLPAAAAIISEDEARALSPDVFEGVSGYAWHDGFDDMGGAAMDGFNKLLFSSQKERRSLLPVPAQVVSKGASPTSPHGPSLSPKPDRSDDVDTETGGTPPASQEEQEEQEELPSQLPASAQVGSQGALLTSPHEPSPSPKSDGSDVATETGGSTPLTPPASQEFGDYDEEKSEEESDEDGLPPVKRRRHYENHDSVVSGDEREEPILEMYN